MRSTLLRGVAIASAAVLALSACSSGDEEPDAGETAAEVPCEPDGVLKIGNLLPQTGNVAFLGPPTFAGTALAVQEINAANGVLGAPIEAFDGDSGDTTTNIAVTKADEMLQQGVDVVVGSASSDVDRTIIDKLTTAGVLQISPANTSTEFIAWSDRGLFFRTAPPDQFQGAVLAEVATNDAVARPAVLARQDSYGESLARTFTDSFTGTGAALALAPVIYDPDAEEFETQVGQIKAASPDGVVLIGFQESSKIILELIKQGIGPNAVKLFLVDGNLSNSLYQDLTAGIMAGTKGTLPGAEASAEFRQQLLAINPGITDFSYGAEAYDAVNLVALAAEAAQSDCGKDIATKMQEVGSGGTKCASFGECSTLLAGGQDIDYDGRSGPVEFADNGDPTQAVMGVYLYGADNKFTPVDFIAGNVPELPAS